MYASKTPQHSGNGRAVEIRRPAATRNLIMRGMHAEHRALLAMTFSVGGSKCVSLLYISQ